MALLWVQEFNDLGTERKGRDTMVGKMPPVQTDKVDYTAGATQSTQPFTDKTHFVRIWSDVDAYVAFGDNPTATNASIPVTGKVAEYFGVKPGSRLSVLAQ